MSGMSDETPEATGGAPSNSGVYTQWNTLTGRIISVGFSQPDEGVPPLYAGARKLWGVELDPRTRWIDPATEEVKERPVMGLAVDRTLIVADGADVAIITGIPAGTTLRVSGREFTVDDGTLEFSSPHRGMHYLRFESFPYQDAEVFIHAT